jgi:hypothetical protein
VKLFVGMIMVVLAIAAVTLGMTTLAYSKRAQDVTAQLDRAQNELRELRGFRRPTPLRWEDSLREFIALEEVPAPRFRGGNPPWTRRSQPQGGAPATGIFEGRERRRQALDVWFQQNIAALEERARTAKTKEAADVATQIAAELAKLNALRAKWDDVRQMPDDSRHEAALQLHAATSAVLASLQALATRDRQLELADLARAMGYTDEKAIQTFVASVAGIYSQTRYNPGAALTNLSAAPPAP